MGHEDDMGFRGMTPQQPSPAGLPLKTSGGALSQTETHINELVLTVDTGYPPLVVRLTEKEDAPVGFARRPLLGSDDGLLGARPFSLQTKRVLDIIGATVGLILLTPIIFLVAVLVVLTSPGPPFFKQRRVGRGGRDFVFYKFRSMQVSAEELLHEIMDHNEVDGPVFKIKDDPRITEVGRFLRRFSIDELPQLWNVLRGDMSLVGPRPPLPEEVAQYSDWERQRLLVKPGITCIWQVSGRSTLDFETWVSMDLEYIRTWRPWLDLVLIARTVPAVLSGRGAY